jgi:hypothetical protein
MKTVDSQNDRNGRHYFPHVRQLYFQKLSLLSYKYPVRNYKEQEVRRPSIRVMYFRSHFTKIEIAKSKSSKYSLKIF